jgi:hypothetical protein
MKFEPKQVRCVAVSETVTTTFPYTSGYRNVATQVISLVLAGYSTFGNKCFGFTMC